MHNDLLFNIALVLGLGMSAQWVAWRLKLPSIIFLLLFGLTVGPVAALFLDNPILDVEHFLGDLLFPVVSASVAVILFEGGLSLRFRDLEGAGGVVGRLVSVGVVITWVIGTISAHFLLDISWEVSLLLSATLIVTGPTVIIPLLKQIRPKGRVGSILRWEGIVIDPIGAILAVLVFEEIIAGPDLLLLFRAIVITLSVGFGLGYVAAQIMVELYRRYWVPDSLQSPITLGFVLVAFTISNIVQEESGLLTVTVLGIAMANQRRFDIHQIVEFKETLQVLLLSSLFILLSARMTPESLLTLGFPTFVFVLIIVLVERPLAAFFSTWGSDLSWKERVFIGWMAPRGIVAASVASIFTLELLDRGVEGAEVLLPVTFAVIIGTVTVYSFTSGVVARRLGLAEKNPQGLLIVGANDWIRAVAKQIQSAGFRVLLADTNQTHADHALEEGLEIYNGNILSEAAQDEIKFGGLGRLLALTANPEVNALAGEHFQTIFGRENVYEISRHKIAASRETISPNIGGRIAFPEEVTHEVLRQSFLNSAKAYTLHIKDVEAVKQTFGQGTTPLFVIPSSDILQIWTPIDTPQLQEGMQLIAMVQASMYQRLIESEAISNESISNLSQETP